ncbi:MAG: LLM class flavin-dependent oxidoreductase, partial [Actinomycetota bacterium]|nr:LLM class flavin-dependent oxidoreductase [Actinomycetota bacterium]
MAVEMIGWIAPRVSSEIVPAEGPPFSAEVIAHTARIHEEADFDRVLIGYFSNAPDGFMIGAHAASVTTRLQFLLAHRPGTGLTLGGGRGGRRPVRGGGGGHPHGGGGLVAVR